MQQSSRPPTPLRLIITTSSALLAFAGNSVLCRMALGEGAIDAAGFTSVRLVSGALVLALLLKLTRRKAARVDRRSMASAAVLFCYAAAFSFAYLSLSTATGALVLFGAVQLTMIMAALYAGERLRRSEWIGTGLAGCGLVYLVYPGVTAPSLAGSLLMTGAGIAWGIYCLIGRSASDPLAETSLNFALSLPFAVILGLGFSTHSHFSLQGVLLAIFSGGLASGVGYAVWYAALQGMSAARASIVQLTVPLLAALGGVVVLGEEISLRLAVAAVVILGGLTLALSARRSLDTPRPLA